jgi:hypothetical protein
LRLRVDPVQVLQHEDEGLDPALAEEQALHRIERELAALREGQKAIVTLATGGDPLQGVVHARYINTILLLASRGMPFLVFRR